ncbi:hypothetical protein BDP27DRAFT_1317959, partial [Rhodocollybia butyracea]
MRVELTQINSTHATASFPPSFIRCLSTSHLASPCLSLYSLDLLPCRLSFIDIPSSRFSTQHLTAQILSDIVSTIFIISQSYLSYHINSNSCSLPCLKCPPPLYVCKYVLRQSLSCPILPPLFLYVPFFLFASTLPPLFLLFASTLPPLPSKYDL